jgi:hypothetical protein
VKRQPTQLREILNNLPMQTGLLRHALRRQFIQGQTKEEHIRRAAPVVAISFESVARFICRNRSGAVETSLPKAKRSASTVLAVEIESLFWFIWAVMENLFTVTNSSASCLRDNGDTAAA